MLHIFSLLVLAFAVSLDGFGVGVTYGMRRIKIPVRSVLIITACSALVILVSMYLGKWLTYFLSPLATQYVGGLILIGIGLWTIYNVKHQQAREEQGEMEQERQIQEPRSLVAFEIKSLGLVIQILKRPIEADIDRSGTISGVEAMFLGLALSLDAFGAGIGAALIGYEPWVTALLIGVSNCLFILTGLKLGFIYSEADWMKRMTYLPGVLLIMCGFFKMI
ncbi:sporulation membrane protein YtaF [Aneurinibacillus thermoaerophilus]|uniref:sporulation membrane protein YtaF n=1 Tax=Aneurinibacillus thermoaerophilus TaxID=143495 RepID=UPI002E1B4737|nr:sporulation membrane protein YtaF [Aneurinibacillus thermoaerophilus]MED0676208.1 sporulation membrane protein YtaF [Aneurinibacillus thermoaerophilus]